MRMISLFDPAAEVFIRWSRSLGSRSIIVVPDIVRPSADVHDVVPFIRTGFPVSAFVTAAKIFSNGEPARSVDRMLVTAAVGAAAPVAPTVAALVNAVGRAVAAEGTVATVGAAVGPGPVVG